jgi:hypothetical protein
MSTTITLKFNHVLRNDRDGVFSIFEGEGFNTPHAKLIRDGSTYQRTSITMLANVPDEGREFAFVAIGQYTACYVERIVKILPGENVVWLVADEEFYFSGYK